MKVSHQLYARRRALQVFDEWLDVTGLVERYSGYYDELCSIIETAVDIGQMVALDVPFHINDDGEAVEECELDLNPKQTPSDPITYSAKIVSGSVVDRDGNVFPEDVWGKLTNTPEGWTMEYIQKDKNSAGS